VQNKTEIIENVSYNYSRDESNLTYQQFSNDTIKSDNKVNALWKWFVIFALILLIIEMLILKYFK